jgi:flagellin
MISIQTNVNSLIAQQNLSVNSAFQSKTIAQLTSGYRINQSGDDAAGLAVANKFRSSVAELTQGVANGNDAAAQLQIMDGGMSNISQILDRLKTLATQSASGTFTGDRTILNKEFQGDVGEIDRQAQSIGLDTGGTFAKSLAVYLGQGSGSQSLSNAEVTVDLSKASVDSQSLGLKGMQAVVGTADLGNSSSTSVANILADKTNLAAVKANLGSTIFKFSGAGFSDVKVSVNPSGVSDLAGLVKNINSAIQNEGNGSATGDTALKAAGIVASVHTDANGGQQLAFTSSTSAFQVAAGDQMANALMGNFSSGSTGASLATTVVGQAITAGALTAGKTIEVKVSGDDFASQTIALSTTTYGTGALAVADLMAEINTGVKADGVTASVAGAALQKAGISVALGGVNNNQLVFTNANNSKFTVQVSGDTGTVAGGGSDALGLGSSLSGAGNAVTYSTLLAGTAYDKNAAAAGQQAGQSAGAQATLEFSVGGGPAVALNSIALDGGDATGGTNKSVAIGTSGLVVLGDASNNKLTFNLDGKAVTTTLSASLNDGKAVVTGSGGTFVHDYTAHAATQEYGAGTFTYDYTAKGAVATAGAGGTFTTDYNGATSNNSFNITYNGTTAKITLNQTDAGIDDIVSDIATQLSSQFGGNVTVGKNGGGTALVFTTTPTGAGQSLSFGAATNGDASTDTTLADLKLDTATIVEGNDGHNGHNSFLLTHDGVTHQIALTGQETNIDSVITDLNTAVNAAFGSHVVTFGKANGHLTVTDSAAGPSHSFSLDAAQLTPPSGGVTDTTLADLGLSSGAHAGTGANGGNNSLLIGYNGTVKTVTLAGNDASIDDMVTDLQNGITAAFGASTIVVGKNTAGSELTLTSTTAGLDSSISINSAVNAVTSGTDSTRVSLGLAAGVQNGDGHTAQDVADAMNAAIANAQLATDPTTGRVGTLYDPLSSAPVATVSVNTSNQIVITNNIAGADHYISNMGGNGAALWGADTLSNNGVTATQAHGTNRTLDNLVAAINSQIGGTSTLSAAGIQASNVGGKLQIASTNSTKFQLNVGAAAAAGTVLGTVDFTAGADFSSAPVTLKLSTDGGVTTTTVNLNQKDAAATDVLAELNGKLVGSGASASLLSVNGKNYIQIATTATGAAASLQILGGTANAALGITSGTYNGTNEVDLGFGSVSNKSFVGNQGINGGVSTLTGVSASGSAQTGGITFSNLAAGGGTQALTISANDSTGAIQAATITLAATNNGTAGLANDGSASSIDSAVKYINSQLQKSNNATLQGIVAVEQNVGGSPEINFISSLSSFQVSVGSNANGGVNLGKAETAAGAITGTGSTIAIDTQTGATAAVAALGAAIGKLGTAQAAVGKGQNQLTYAISLAQSQITNFSAAESQIRDANVAQQAANLSKAQVLSQASIAAMAQANSAPQAVLSLLRG